MISISKTKKMIARRKNRREKGVRALFFGSKPHSNGEGLSREGWLFKEMQRAKIVMANGIRSARDVLV